MPKEECKHGKKAPVEVLENLPNSQGGTGRHKCCICAYQIGFKEGFEEGQGKRKKEG